MSVIERFRQRSDSSKADSHHTLARNRLGVPQVVFFGIAGAAPLTVILGAVSTIYGVVGNTAVPADSRSNPRHRVQPTARAE